MHSSVTWLQVVTLCIDLAAPPRECTSRILNNVPFAWQVLDCAYGLASAGHSVEEVEIIAGSLATQAQLLGEGA